MSCPWIVGFSRNNSKTKFLCQQFEHCVFSMRGSTILHKPLSNDSNSSTTTDRCIKRTDDCAVVLLVHHNGPSVSILKPVRSHNRFWMYCRPRCNLWALQRPFQNFLWWFSSSENSSLNCIFIKMKVVLIANQAFSIFSSYTFVLSLNQFHFLLKPVAFIKSIFA